MALLKGKPGKTKISEEDWTRYVDAVRREAVRRRGGKHPEEQEEQKK